LFWAAVAVGFYVVFFLSIFVVVEGVSLLWLLFVVLMLRLFWPSCCFVSVRRGVECERWEGCSPRVETLAEKREGEREGERVRQGGTERYRETERQRDRERLTVPFIFSVMCLSWWHCCMRVAVRVAVRVLLQVAAAVLMTASVPFGNAPLSALCILLASMALSPVWPITVQYLEGW
jgi:hypothetical protein